MYLPGGILTNEEKGLGLILTGDLVIMTIHFYSGSDGVGKTFEGKLPFDVKFNYSKEDIEFKLGKADVNGGGYEHSMFGYITEWSKYFFDNYSLHFQFSVDKSYIMLITVSSLKE